MVFGSTGRSQPHSAATIEAAASAPSIQIARGVRAGIDVIDATVAVAVVKLGFVNASANAFAVAKRSAGNFSNACSTAIATCGGTLGRKVRTGWGAVVISLAMIACALEPECGGSPVSISYVTAASE